MVYVDGYGNAMLGRRASTLQESARILRAGQLIPSARTFSEVPRGAAFSYGNANGLAEIAVNQGRACDVLGLCVGDAVKIWEPDLN